MEDERLKEGVNLTPKNKVSGEMESHFAYKIIYFIGSKNSGNGPSPISEGAKSL